MVFDWFSETSCVFFCPFMSRVFLVSIENYKVIRKQLISNFLIKLKPRYFQKIGQFIKSSWFRFVLWSVFRVQLNYFMWEPENSSTQWSYIWVWNKILSWSRPIALSNTSWNFTTCILWFNILWYSKIYTTQQNVTGQETWEESVNPQMHKTNV